VQFRGREIAHTDLGKKLLLRFAEDLAGVGTIEGQPKMEGRNAHVLISPVKMSAEKPKKERPKPHASDEGAPPAQQA
jgi:translation initiation factor IF-3